MTLRHSGPLTTVTIAALLTAAALAGLCHTRARQSWETARALDDCGDKLLAIREYATAIRYHVPLSRVTRDSAHRLLALGGSSEALGDRGGAVAAYQALAAALEAIARPLPVEPTSKAAARERLGVLLATEIPEPLRASASTWIPSVLFSLWCITVCALLSCPPSRRWAFAALAVLLQGGWLVSLRLV